jgi:OOP family OmpA-OmpF porin
MQKNNIELIEISGHTDSDGSDAYNLKLSDGRAKAVVQYLISKGIQPTRMKAVGYGESKPIDTNKTDEGKSRNRRVEFTLLKK